MPTGGEIRITTRNADLDPDYAAAHPEAVQAGEAYTLDVTVTNTSSATVNLVRTSLKPSLLLW